MIGDLKAMFARWECTLNIWQWPADMPFKPKDWESLVCFSSDKTKRTRFTVSGKWMTLLKFLAGEKECMRWWHVNELGSTEVEFERWWALEQLERKEKCLDG